LVNIEAKTKALFAKTLIRTPGNFLSRRQATRNLTRNMREWAEYADNIAEVDRATTKSIYLDLMRNSNKTPRVEIKYPEIDWRATWMKIKLNFIPTDWKMAVYLILNDTIANNHKMFRHRIVGVQTPNCSVCGRCDTNAHRIKDCIFSNISWMWLRSKLVQRIGLEIDDPEELLSAKMESGVWAGLWLLFGVIHYNIRNYDIGTIEEMLDGMRKCRWQRKDELERICGRAINCF